MANFLFGTDLNDARGPGSNSTDEAVVVGFGGSDILTGGRGSDQLFGEGHALVDNNAFLARYVLDLAGSQLINGLGGPAGFGEHVLPAGAAASGAEEGK